MRLNFRISKKLQVDLRPKMCFVSTSSKIISQKTVVVDKDAFRVGRNEAESD